MELNREVTAVPSTGVYFSANDIVLPWCYAFLASIRSHSPSLRIYLIPFNEECKKTIALCRNFNVDVYTHESFGELENIGRRLELGHTATGHFWFRRFAAFWGPLDRFLYLDVRQCVLADLRHWIELLDNFPLDLIHYDVALDQVYASSAFRQKLLVQGRAHGFNSGRWASKKDLFTFSDLSRIARFSVENRTILNPRNTDQFFLNLLCDLSNTKTAHVAEMLGDTTHSGWAGQRGTAYCDSQHNYRWWDHGGLEHRKRLILLHWAGYRLSPGIPQFGIFAKYYRQGGGSTTNLLRWRLQRPLYLAMNTARKSKTLQSLRRLVKQQSP